LTDGRSEGFLGLWDLGWLQRKTMLVFGAAMYVPEECICAAEPPAEQLWEAEIPDTRPLTYVEVPPSWPQLFSRIASCACFIAESSISSLAPLYGILSKVRACQAKFFRECGGSWCGLP